MPKKALRIFSPVVDAPRRSDVQAGPDVANFVDRPIWDGLIGSDADGVYLIGGTCMACGFTTLGVREICPECWAHGMMAEAAIGRRATLYTFTVIHQLPPGYDAPFAVGYFDLAERVRVFAHVENDAESLLIGRELHLSAARLRTDDDGTSLVGPFYRARPTEEL